MFLHVFVFSLLLSLNPDYGYPKCLILNKEGMKLRGNLIHFRSQLIIVIIIIDL